MMPLIVAQPLIPEVHQEREYLTKGAYHWNYDPQERGGAMLRTKYELVLERIKAANPKIVLDIGCGDCFFTEMLEREFFDVTGIDYSALALSLGKDKAPDVKTVLADARDLPLKDESVDAVCLVETLEHNPFADGAKIIEEVYRVLKKNGSLVLTVPSTNLPLSAKHYTHYETRTLSAVLNGFSEKSIEGIWKQDTGLFGQLLRLSSNRHWRIPLWKEALYDPLFKTLYASCKPEEATSLMAVCKK